MDKEAKRLVKALHKNPIVKVQVPLMSNEEGGMEKALVYNKDRSYDVFMLINDDLLESLDGAPKGYWRASYDPCLNNTVLEERVEDQPW